MRSIDLNADLGEGCGQDDALLEVVTSASIACGAHAGDVETMRRTVEAAAMRGARVGAHVSYDDREGFGRRETGASPRDVRDGVIRQLESMLAVTSGMPVQMNYVKPHGALYHRVATDIEATLAVVDAMNATGAPLVLLLAQPSPGARTAGDAGVRVVAECFADRAYNADGTLVGRGITGAVIDDVDVAAERAAELATNGTVAAIDGTVIEVPAESICVHGDTPNSVLLANRVREALVIADVVVCAFT